MTYMMEDPAPSPGAQRAVGGAGHPSGSAIAASTSASTSSITSRGKDVRHTKADG